VTERYELICAERANFKVTMMTRLLEVSRSGFYNWSARQLDPGSDPLAALKEKIKELWEKSKHRHGVRRIHQDLIDLNIDVTLYMVRKCMRDLGICGIQPRAKKRTTIPSEDAALRPDLIKRDFTAAVPTTKLVGDITYLKTKEGWLYLAVVIDLCTRCVVGWSMDTHMKASLVTAALRMAVLKGYVALGAIFHSDRGTQYTSKEYSDYAASREVRLSVGKTGSSADNAVAESFFSMLKNEMYHLQEFNTRAEARSAVMEYIEIDYNRQRRHSTIDYQIPQEKMDAFFERTDASFSLPKEIKLDLAA
jgi:transposase InsO family protein